MPLYEYECEACGHRFEVIRKFSDAPLERCPKCGGAVHKLQSAPAFHLKGSGWYVTDYARKDSGSRPGEAKSGTGGGESTSGDESKTSAASETKADTKTDSAKSDATPSSSDSKPTKTST
jgi:putative FmdB family regulatory protein